MLGEDICNTCNEVGVNRIPENEPENKKQHAHSIMARDILQKRNLR